MKLISTIAIIYLSSLFNFCCGMEERGSNEKTKQSSCRKASLALRKSLNSGKWCETSDFEAYIAALKKMIEDGAHVNTFPNAQILTSQTPLTSVCRVENGVFLDRLLNRIKMTSFLLEQGADPNDRVDSFQEKKAFPNPAEFDSTNHYLALNTEASPLELVAYHGDVTSIILLAEYGAHINLQDENLAKRINTLFENEEAYALDNILSTWRFPRFPSALPTDSATSCHAQRQIIKLIILQQESEALKFLESSVNEINPEQLGTIFLVAAGQNMPEIINYILRHNTSPELHQEAFLRASASGHTSIINLLLDSAILETETWIETLNRGLYLAAIRGHVEVVRLFRERFSWLNFALIANRLHELLELNTISPDYRIRYRAIDFMLTDTYQTTSLLDNSLATPQVNLLIPGFL